VFCSDVFITKQSLTESRHAAPNNTKPLLRLSACVLKVRHITRGKPNTTQHEPSTLDTPVKNTSYIRLEQISEIMR
jgi:hypothetical protein